MGFNNAKIILYIYPCPIQVTLKGIFDHTGLKYPLFKLTIMISKPPPLLKCHKRLPSGGTSR